MQFGNLGEQKRTGEGGGEGEGVTFQSLVCVTFKAGGGNSTANDADASDSKLIPKNPRSRKGASLEVRTHTETGCVLI